MPPLAYYLAAFAVYTISIILLTGQSFPQRESLRSFLYRAARRAAVAYGRDFLRYVDKPAFARWLQHVVLQRGLYSLLGFGKRLDARLSPLPVHCQAASPREGRLSAGVGSKKLTATRACGSSPAAAMVLLYTIYLVIQFRAFGIIVSYMLEIPRGFASTSLIYLFVLYTTFWRLSVGRAQRHAESAAYRSRGQRRGVVRAARRFQPLCCGRCAEVGGRTAAPPRGFLFRDALSGTVIMLAWGLGVAGNPQYAIRIIACRSKKEAFRLISVSPYIIGWVYLCVTFFVMACRTAHPFIGNIEETLGFATLGQFLPPFAAFAAAYMRHSFCGEHG